MEDQHDQNKTEAYPDSSLSNEPQPVADETQPQPFAPVAPSPVNPSPAKTSSKKSLKSLLWVVIVLMACAGAVLAAFLLLKPQTPQQLYESSFENSIYSDSKKQAYISFDIKSDNMTLEGEATGNVSGSEGSMQSNILIQSSSQGVPLSMDVDMRVPSAKEKKVYMKYNKVSSSDPTYGPYISSLFDSISGKWIQTSNDDTTDTASDFSKDGPTAVFDIAGLYVPLTSLNAKDKTTYLNGIHKYHLFTVGDDVKETTFKGVSAREIKVTIDKDALKQFDKDMASSLSKDADYQSMSTKYINDFFGDKQTFTANVYLHPDQEKITGIAYDVNFAQEMTDTTFDVSTKSIKTSLLIDYNRKLVVEVPKDYMSEQQFSQAIGV